MINNVENGMTIYFYRDLESYVKRGNVKDSTILDAGIDNIKVISKVAWEANVDSEGKEVRRIGGTSGVRLDQAFLTAKEANDAQKAEVEKHKEELRSEITDIESLLKFPLDHCLNGDEYTDWQARAVYEEYIEKYKKGELK
jgi:hypothetical protein